MRILFSLLLTVLSAATVFAQQRPAPVVEFAAGSMLFADDGIVSESLVGANMRIYVTPRISLGPEVALIGGESHSHLMLTGNVTFDWLRPRLGVPRLVTPYVVAGAGMFQTREMLFSGPYTSTEGGFTAGLGVRGHPSERLVIGAETRIGWEMHLRFNAVVGVRLGG